MKKIVITKEKLIALLILFPYIENNFLQKYIQIYFENTYIRAISVLSIFVTIIFLSMIIVKRKITFNRIKVYLLMYIVYSILGVLFSWKGMLNSFCVWIWVCVPILFAIVVIDYCESVKVNYLYIIYNMIKCFCLYVIIVIAYYIPVHHLFIDSSVRLNPRGGGAVIFGYTIAVIFALTVMYRDIFENKKEYYFILAVLSVGAIATASRAAVWPVVFLWIINFMWTKLTSKKLLFTIVLIPIFVFLTMVDFSKMSTTTTFVGLDRLFNTSSFRRAQTTTNIFSLFSDFEICRKLFGFGLGNFFPYQKWCLYVNDVDLNMIRYNGVAVLVQPHNSFLYELMEGGIIGLLLMVSSFICAIKTLLKYKNSNYIFGLAFIGVMLLVNCFDSVLFVQPGVAGSFWLLLMISINGSRQLYKQGGKSGWE